MVPRSGFGTRVSFTVGASPGSIGGKVLLEGRADVIRVQASDVDLQQEGRAVVVEDDPFERDMLRCADAAGVVLLVNIKNVDPAGLHGRGNRRHHQQYDERHGHEPCHLLALVPSTYAMFPTPSPKMERRCIVLTILKTSDVCPVPILTTRRYHGQQRYIIDKSLSRVHGLAPSCQARHSIGHCLLRFHI